MTLEVFPFRLTMRPAPQEYPVTRTRIVGENDGTDQRAAEYGDDFKIRAVGAIRLPQSSTSKTLDDWLEFVESVRGGHTTFLYKCYTDRYHQVVDEEIGTGDGVETDFPLVHRYIDATSLSVEVNGSPVTSPGDYSLQDNEVAPYLQFVAPVTNTYDIVVSYDFYVPMRLESDGIPIPLLASKPTDATRNVIVPDISMIAVAAGGWLV